MAVLVEIKQHPRNSVLGQVRPHLVNTTAHGAAYRHPHGPAKLNRLDVFADTFTILAGREAFQPFPNWLPAGLRPIKDGLDALTVSEAGRFLTLIGLGLLTFVKHKVVYHIRSTSDSKALRIPDWSWSLPDPPPQGFHSWKTCVRFDLTRIIRDLLGNTAQRKRLPRGAQSRNLV